MNKWLLQVSQPPIYILNSLWHKAPSTVAYSGRTRTDKQTIAQQQNFQTFFEQPSNFTLTHGNNTVQAADKGLPVTTSDPRPLEIMFTDRLDGGTLSQTEAIAAKRNLQIARQREMYSESLACFDKEIQLRLLIAKAETGAPDKVIGLKEQLQSAQRESEILAEHHTAEIKSFEK